MTSVFIIIISFLVAIGMHIVTRNVDTPYLFERKRPKDSEERESEKELTSVI